MVPQHLPRVVVPPMVTPSSISLKCIWAYIVVCIGSRRISTAINYSRNGTNNRWSMKDPATVDQRPGNRSYKTRKLVIQDPVRDGHARTTQVPSSIKHSKRLVNERPCSGQSETRKLVTHDPIRDSHARTTPVPSSQGTVQWSQKKQNVWLITYNTLQSNAIGSQGLRASRRT